MNWISNYIRQNLAQLDANGISVDETINVLTGGQSGMTVSMRAAIGAGYRADGRTGERKAGWCLFCTFLSWVVQRNHCADQFVPGPTDWRTWIRAGIAFSIGIFGAISLVRHIVRVLISIL